MKPNQMISLHAVKISAAALFAASSFSGLTAQTVLNGGFEQVSNPSTVTPGNSQPQTDFVGWDQPNDPYQGVLYGAEGYIPNAVSGVTDGWFSIGVPFSPQGGIFAAAAGSDDNDGFYGENIFQTISGFEVGTSYEVSFWQVNLGTTLANNQTAGHWNASLFGDVQPGTVLQYEGEGNQTWVQQTFTFVANATSGVLDLRPITESAAGGAFLGVDSVTVTAVPEPSSTMLLGGAVMGLAFFRRRHS